MALTDIEIKKAKCDPDKKTVLKDSAGLYLEISTNDVKSWRLRIRSKMAGDTIKTLGHYPDMTLAQARKAANGVRTAPVTPLSVTGPTFKEVALAWHARSKDRWKENHAADVLRGLENHLFPAIGNKDVQAIYPLTLATILEQIEARGIHHVAHDARQRLEGIFRYAKAKGICDTNPAADFKDVLKALPPAKHRPAVSTVEAARKVLKDTEVLPQLPVTRLAHRFLALTCIRPGELALAQWPEFKGLDGDDPLWHIPKGHMKGKKDHARDHFVPLSTQAVAILIELRQLTGKLEWAFPNAIIADAPMSENALSSLLIRAGYKDIHVPHGWRSTFSTVMNGRRPQDRAYIDLMLAHKVKDKIESAYNRQPYWPARRDIAQEWANILLAGMAPPAELVKLERRGNSAWNKVDLTATV